MVKKRRWGVFKSFQGQMLHVQCTSSSMLVTEIALTIFSSRYLKMFAKFHTLHCVCVFFNATRLLYNMSFIIILNYCIQKYRFILFYACKWFHPVLNSPICNCVKREIICMSEIRPALNSRADNVGERGKNKKRGIFPGTQYFSNEHFYVSY